MEIKGSWGDMLNHSNGESTRNYRRSANVIVTSAFDFRPLNNIATVWTLTPSASESN